MTNTSPQYEPIETLTDLPRKYFFANRPIEASGDNYDEKLSDVLSAQVSGYPLPSDPNESVATTLRAHGLSVYPSEIPDALTYISARIRHSDDGFPGFNYGTFVSTESGHTAFAKLRYGPRNTEKELIDGELVDVRVGGMLREMQILESLAAHGYEVPKVLGYSSSSPDGLDLESNESDTLETLYIEAIPPEEGSTLPPEYWSADMARIAANKMKTFAKNTAEIEMFSTEARTISVETLLRRSELERDEYSAEVSLILESYGHIDEPIVVHGDTWLNNIIVKNDNSDVLFVDWELAGSGYRGQDAGRTLWGLTLNQDWEFDAVGDSAMEFIGTWSSSEDEKNNLRFGIMLESLRWIADRQDKLKNEITDEEAISLIEQIEDIKQHSLKIILSIADTPAMPS